MINLSKSEVDKLLQETDWLYCDDVKDSVSNIDQFTSYRQTLRLIRINLTSENNNIELGLPTKPTIVWDFEKLSGVTIT